MALGLLLIEGGEFVLKGVGKQLMAILPQEHKQLGTADTLDERLFRWRQLNWWMPQGWTHGKPSLLNGKKMMVCHATTPRKNTRPVFLVL